MVNIMLNKTFLKKSCKVEFVFPADTADSIETVGLAGTFNNWDSSQTPLHQKGQVFTVTLTLPLEQDIQFRYVVNGHSWYNDPEADAVVPNPFGGTNSVVSTHQSAEATV